MIRLRHFFKLCEKYWVRCHKILEISTPKALCSEMDRIEILQMKEQYAPSSVSVCWRCFAAKICADFAPCMGWAKDYAVGFERLRRSFSIGDMVSCRMSGDESLDLCKIEKAAYCAKRSNETITRRLKKYEIVRLARNGEFYYLARAN